MQSGCSVLLANACIVWCRTLSQRGSSDAPLPEETVQYFRNSLSELLASANLPCDWTIPPGQPFYLHVMQSLSLLLQDPDNSLFFHLVQGVPTGYKNDIPPSNCFPVKQEHLPEPPPLSVHHVNWKSAEDNLPMTRELVQAEVEAGCVSPFSGTRLVVDSTIFAG